MEISVVIATYKRPELLGKCLEQLAHQILERSRFEIIIVSDGPDNETAKIIRSFRTVHPYHHWRYLSSEVRKGPATARNIGWMAAQSPLIAFTDDDCLPAPDWLSTYLEAAALHTNDTVFTGRVIVPIPPQPTDYQKNIANLETAEFVTANCCCPKHLLELVAGFDECYKFAWREDSDLHFKFLSAGINLIRSEYAIVIHPVRKAAWGVSIVEQKKSMFNALLYRKFPSLYRDHISIGPVWLYYAIITAAISAVLFAIAGNHQYSFFACAIWALLTMYFFRQRSEGTSKRFLHVSEMLITSLIIPFLSVYWTVRGAIRYRVLFF